MKELTEHEVLAIAGGLPLAAALDEVSYRAPAEPLLDPLACRHAAERRPEDEGD
jgi:hypothetical protein